MTGPNNEEHTDFNALRSLNTIQLPAGMQDRLAENLVQRLREQQLHPTARGLKKYVWELWAGASIAVVTAAVILCVFAAQSHRTTNQSQVALIPAHSLSPTSISTPVSQANNPPYKTIRVRQTQKGASASIPHTPPPQPLTSQERLLLTLANTPSLAAGLVQMQEIPQHGLGPNTLFELEHEDLLPMRSGSKDLQPLQPLPNNLP